MEQIERWEADAEAPRVTPGHIRNLEQIESHLNGRFGRGLQSRSAFYVVFNTPPEPCPMCGRVRVIVGRHVGENWQPLQDCAILEHGIGSAPRELVAIWFDDHWQLLPDSGPKSMIDPQQGAGRSE